MDLSKVKFDEKGLVPAVVQDGNGTVLMLAYMNEESLAKTLETGYTWFWSRSRQELWNKGGTSGHLQKVKEILYDCDGDTLLVKVDQTGVACHTGSYTCFDGRLIFKSEEEQLNQERNFVKSFLHVSSQENCVNTRREQQLMPPPPEHPVPAGARVYRLPEPDMLPDKEMNFLELIEVRGSIRQYSEKEITLQELSYLLWCTQGVKMVQPNGTTMRNVPSAGARHAFETYLLINRVEGIPSGIYRFLALGHALLPVSTEQADIDKFIEGIKSHGLAKNSAVTFIWTADYQRMSYAFGNRAIRYVYLDAGHVCQNLYLAAYTMQIGTCALGAFYEDKLNEVLGLDGENDFVVYGASVGKPEL